jgi:hypothetical protein
MNNAQVAADLRRLADLIESSPHRSHTVVHIHGLTERTRDMYTDHLGVEGNVGRGGGCSWYEADMPSGRVEVVLHYEVERVAG